MPAATTHALPPISQGSRVPTLPAPNFPLTRQGVRNLDATPLPTLSGGSGVNVSDNERMLSNLIGGALAGFGLSRGSLLGLAVAAFGGGLMYRGMSGHCALYAAAGMNTAGETVLNRYSSASGGTFSASLRT